MTESDVKRIMSQSVKNAKGYARRIEDSYTVGMFDMLLIPLGLPVFTAEVKVVKGNWFGPSPRQHIELARIETVAAQAGHVIPVMIGYRDGLYYFHKPKGRIGLKDCFTTPLPEFHDQLVAYYHHLQKGKNEPQHSTRQTERV